MGTVPSSSVRAVAAGQLGSGVRNGIHEAIYVDAYTPDENPHQHYKDSGSQQRGGDGAQCSRHLLVRREAAMGTLVFLEPRWWTHAEPKAVLIAGSTRSVLHATLWPSGQG